MNMAIPACAGSCGSPRYPTCFVTDQEEGARPRHRVSGSSTTQQYLSVFRPSAVSSWTRAAAEDITQETSYAPTTRHRTRRPRRPAPGCAASASTCHLLPPPAEARASAARRLYIARTGGSTTARSPRRSHQSPYRVEPQVARAVILHYYDGLTREEIASVLGVPAGTVASRIAKAVAIMRKSIGSDQDLGPERSSSEGALRGR